jgi:uncharacterized membrane protein YfcA
MIIVLYVLAVLIGISLGLMGAGGAIVAVPAFVYLGGYPPPTASGYALFVVAFSTMVGVYHAWRSKLIVWRAVFAFGATTMITIAAVRSQVLPRLPETLFPSLAGGIARDSLLMLAFGAVLLYAGIAMVRHKALPRAHDDHPHPAVLSAYGLIIGIVSGFLGVGGGFLMTPVLTMWAGLDMKHAVGTSLVLICANSFIGVGSDLASGLHYDWPFVITFTALTTVGIVIGSRFARTTDSATLKRYFGWLVITLGVAILVREIV